MGFWLAAHRNGQDSDYIQRFDPRFWTVNFPRPAMASVVATAADALRVDVEFHHRDELAGLIWDSTDGYDHPLLAYATDRDYSRTHLRFRWRSSGILALDVANGPTLTIEGRDAGGQPRTWYVRLWNYATGTPTDAVIDLPFSDLFSGWDAVSSTDAIHAPHIDRLFISLAPAGFDPLSSAPLPARVDGWAEMSEISCTGDRPMVRIGDVMLPPHGINMATAYDDSYHLTPARLLRTIRGLGYRGAITHYVGMSHYYRLAPTGAGATLEAAPELCGPAQAWHRSLFDLCAAQGFAPIVSLSFELLAQHCPPTWAQRFADGTQALTGWSPPSTLLSPAHPSAMAFLQEVARKFTSLVEDAGLPVAFQIGEPWWWTATDGRIALYDDAARTAFGGNPPVIADLRQTLDAGRKALLDNAGAALASATAALRDAVRDAASGPAEIMLLVFTPTVLDPAMPELRRANLPAAWAHPTYDRLQLEDYDWLTGRAIPRQSRTISRASCSIPPTATCGGGSTPALTKRWRAMPTKSSSGPARRSAATVTSGFPTVRKTTPCWPSMMFPIRWHWAATPRSRPNFPPMSRSRHRALNGATACGPTPGCVLMSARASVPTRNWAN